MAHKEFGIAIAGVGTVGGALALQIAQEADLIAGKTGIRPVLRGIIEKNTARVQELGFPASLQRSLEEVVADPAINIVVELVGGLGFARTVIETALKSGKAVVTANKALLAHSGTELFALARAHGTHISFEASCEGAVPIIRALCDGVIANRVNALYGIVNGTCNYILSAMTSKGQSYADALKEAQAGGLAEADPTLDVTGMDTAHKLTILSSLAFGVNVQLDSFPVTGINALDIQDINNGKDLGYVVKLLAVAIRRDEGLSLSVRPCFISVDHPLAWVSGSFNAVSVYGHAAGHSMYYGRGAGGLPTSSAVMADIVSSALGTAKILFDNLGIYPDRSAKATILPSDRDVSRYYIRLIVQDKPGVLAQVAGIFGRNDISISSALQKESAQPSNGGPSIPFVITTHRTSAANIQKAREEILRMKECSDEIAIIPIIDEHEEY